MSAAVLDFEVMAGGLTSADPDQRPKCAGHSAEHAMQLATIFEATEPRMHKVAATYCARCPLVQRCVREAVAIADERPASWRGGPDGTWGGLLWVNGRILRTVH